MVKSMNDQFNKDICRVVGHELVKSTKLFAEVCTRCDKLFPWFNKTGIAKIASALVSPLKNTLDYQSIGKKLIKGESLPLSELP